MIVAIDINSSQLTSFWQLCNWHYPQSAISSTNWTWKDMNKFENWKNKIIQWDIQIWGARSRLHRSRFSQRNTRCRTLVEIYHIQILWDFHNRKILTTFSFFATSANIWTKPATLNIFYLAQFSSQFWLILMRWFRIFTNVLKNPESRCNIILQIFSRKSEFSGHEKAKKRR